MMIVEFDQVIDPVINQRAIELSGRLRERVLPGVRDVVTGYCSVGVHFDPLRTDLARLEAAIESDARAAESVMVTALTRVHDIPVWYGGANGPDLAGRGRGMRLPHRRCHRAPRRQDLSRLHARIRAGLCLSRARGSPHRRAAPPRPERTRAGRRRSASRANKPGSIQSRPLADGSSSAAPRRSCSILTVNPPVSSPPVKACGSCRNDGHGHPPRRQAGPAQHRAGPRALGPSSFGRARGRPDGPVLPSSGESPCRQRTGRGDDRGHDDRPGDRRGCRDGAGGVRCGLRSHLRRRHGRHRHVVSR